MQHCIDADSHIVWGGERTLWNPGTTLSDRTTTTGDFTTIKPFHKINASDSEPTNPGTDRRKAQTDKRWANMNTRRDKPFFWVWKHTLKIALKHGLIYQKCFTANFIRPSWEMKNIIRAGKELSLIFLTRECEKKNPTKTAPSPIKILLRSRGQALN